MAEADDTQVFLELTAFSLHALRSVDGKIEAGGECVLENKPALEALLDAVAPNRAAAGIRAGTSVWPAAAQWHLSTDTEAMLDRTPDAMRTIAMAKQRDPRAPLAYACCNATDGDEVTADGMDKWVMAFAPLDSLETVSKGLVDLNVDPDDVKPAGLTSLGAVGSAIRIEETDGGVLLWDIGAAQSSLVLMTPMGVTEAASCPVGMDAIFETVQSVLKLKFRGAGARLFFNESYDFSEAGPKIAAAVGAVLKEVIAKFPPTSIPPVFGSLTLTGKQSWFIREVAAAVGLGVWEPSVAKVAAKLGLSFKEPDLAAAFSASSFGLFELVSMRIRPRDKWNTQWAEAAPPPDEEVAVVEDDEPIDEPIPAPPPPVRPPPRPAPAPAPAPTLRAKPSLAPESLSPPPAPAPEPAAGPRMAVRAGGAPPPMPLPSAAPVPGARAPMPQLSTYTSPPPPTRLPPPVAPAPPAFPVHGGTGPASPPSYSAPAFPLPGAAPTTTPFPEPGGGAVPSSAPLFPPIGRVAPAPPAAPAFPTPGGSKPPAYGAPAFPAPGATAAPYAAPRSTSPPFPSLGGAAFPEPGAPPRPPSANPFPAPGQAAAPDPMSTNPFPLPGQAAAPRAPAPLPLGTIKPIPAAGAAGVPFGARPQVGVTRATYDPDAVEAAPPRSKVGFYIGVGVAAAVVFAAIAVVVESRLERIKATDLQQQEELARKVTEQRLREAEEAAKAQAEASRKEMEAAILQAKREAEEDTKHSIQVQEEQQRLAHLPGSLLVTTVPEGASVSIDNGPLLTTPVRAEGLVIGAHKVHIFLAGHDSADLTAEIRPGKTTDLGSVPLASIYGGMDITSSPDNLEYTVRAVNNIMSRPIASGTTPGIVTQLPFGDYLVTFHRPGCRDHNESVTVERGSRANVTTAYQDGSLELSSDPSGASVSKDGSFLGTTPLVMHNLTPKMASFELDLPGYDPTPVSVEIPEGQTLKYEAQVLRKDRIFTLKEVKNRPVRLDGATPQLSADQKVIGGTVLLSFVVRRNGSVSDVEVVHTSDDDIARRCKNTVQGWHYKPGTAADDRTVDTQVEESLKFVPAP